MTDTDTHEKDRPASEPAPQEIDQAAFDKAIDHWWYSQGLHMVVQAIRTYDRKNGNEQR